MPRSATTSRRIRKPPQEEETQAKRFARIRKERGFTQAELAAALDTVQTVISDYERGKTRAHAEMVAKMAQVLSVSADELLGLKKPEKERNGISRKILRRAQMMEELPPHDQKSVFKFIDLLVAEKKSQATARKK